MESTMSILCCLKMKPPTSAMFQFTDTNFYVPLVTLSTKTDKKLLDQLKLKFKRNENRNKYR